MDDGRSKATIPAASGVPVHPLVSPDSPLADADFSVPPVEGVGRDDPLGASATSPSQRLLDRKSVV